MGIYVIRIDPAKRTIATLSLDEKAKNFVKPIQRMAKAKQLGHRQLCEMGGTPLMVATNAAAEEGQPGFRFYGVNSVTAGIGVLFGRGQAGLVSCPVTKAWVEQRIIWTDVAETDEAGSD